MKVQHVMPRDGHWVVKGEGNRRVTRVATTRRQALQIARRIARNQGTDVVIHDRDGSAREDYYGNDPLPRSNGRA